tara:strand:+ start:2256 stop:2624 length:369 start_codon:yes stop_codon:yes gene_type:complete
MSNLQKTGTIKVINELESGVSKSSGKSWKKISFVIETEGDYPKTVCFGIFGEEKVDNFVKFNKIGQRVDVSFDVESREYKGKYYTDLNAWKVFTNKGEAGDSATSAEQRQATAASSDDSMPF